MSNPLKDKYFLRPGMTEARLCQTTPDAIRLVAHYLADLRYPILSHLGPDGTPSSGPWYIWNLTKDGENLLKDLATIMVIEGSIVRIHCYSAAFPQRFDLADPDSLERIGKYLDLMELYQP
jgi:hypothetical protein